MARPVRRQRSNAPIVEEQSGRNIDRPALSATTMARDIRRAVRRTATCALFCASVSVSATSLSSAQGQDTVAGLRSDKLVERSHAATVTMGRGHARIVVQRTVFNGGGRHDQATFHIFPPPGAVAVGLRTAGIVDGRTRWFEGELMEAEAAAEKYLELTGVGGYYPKDPALLSWRSQDHLALQVFPCAPLQPKTIEYSLVVPTEYRDGAHHLALPAMGTEKQLAMVTVTTASSYDRLVVDGRRVVPGAQVKLSPTGEVDLALLPYNPAQLEGALADKKIAPGRVLTRFRIEAAPKLTEVPRNARVVVVLDTSRSMAPLANAQAAAARAYLSHFADARVRIMSFDRFVRERSHGFEPIAVARQTLQSYRPTFANGSQVDDALVEADFALSRITGTAPLRIVLFTDARTRTSLKPARIANAVRRSGAVVHIGVVTPGQAELVRTDEHEWAAALRPTGGLVWQAFSDDRDQQGMAKVYEELARPMRIDHLKVDTSVLGVDEATYQERLDEGQGLTHSQIATQSSGWVRVRGELWASPVSQVIQPDAGETKLWSALVFGTPLLHELTEAEMMPLAMYGGAVSPVTSYLAIEPGVRPSTEGLEAAEVGTWGAGGLGMSGFGSGGGGRGGSVFDPDAYLRRALAGPWAKCGGTPNSASVRLETTLDEVVDVPAVQFEGSADKARCLREAAWALGLPSAFVWPLRSWSIRV
jgi:von Willebrand factor type A domain